MSSAVEFEYTTERNGEKLVATGETFVIDADMVFWATGQSFAPEALNGSTGPPSRSKAGRIKVDAERRTSMPGVWAGGDCVAGGRDLTVVAVEDGKRAALSIDRWLAQGVARAA